MILIISCITTVLSLHLSTTRGAAISGSVKLCYVLPFKRNLAQTYGAGSVSGNSHHRPAEPALLLLVYYAHLRIRPFCGADFNNLFNMARYLLERSNDGVLSGARLIGLASLGASMITAYTQTNSFLNPDWQT